MKKTPFKAKIYFVLALLCFAIPTFIAVHQGEAGRVILFTEDAPASYFDRAVIYIAEHDIHYAYGVILNKPIAKNAMRPDKIPPSFGPIYEGGPVIEGEGNNIYVLFKETAASARLQLMPMNTLLENAPHFFETHDPALVRLFYGYAGWAFYQLDFEMLKSIWAVNEFKVPDELSKIDEQADQLLIQALSQNRVKKEQTF